MLGNVYYRFKLTNFIYNENFIQKEKTIIIEHQYTGNNWMQQIHNSYVLNSRINSIKFY